MVEVEGRHIGAEEFDGELVVIADCEFSEKNPFDVVIVDRERGDIIETGPEVCQLLRRHNDLPSQAYRTLAPAKIDLLNLRIANARGALSKQFDERIIDLLLEGRIRTACVIDSDGGDTDELAKYQGAMKYLDRNGGEVQSFVTGHGSSSGFELMSSAQRTNVMFKTSLLWHFSDSEGERRTAVDSLRNSLEISGIQLEELDDFFEFLQNSKMYNPKMRQEFLDEIAHADNPEGELYFSGGELYAMGLVNSAYAKVGNMRRRFSKLFHAGASSRVREFWELSKVMMREADVAGEGWDKFDFEKRRAELKGG